MNKVWIKLKIKHKNNIKISNNCTSGLFCCLASRLATQEKSSPFSITFNNVNTWAELKENSTREAN